MKIIYNNFHLLILFYIIIPFTSEIVGYYEDFFSSYYIANNYNYAQRRNIENSINKTVKPCEDFYEYACGNYIYDNNNKNYQEITQYLDYQFNQKLLEVIRPEGLLENFCKNIKNFFSQPQQTFVEKMENYYVACSSERKGNFWKYLKQLQINWPLLQKDTSIYTKIRFNSKDFWHVLGLLHSYNCKNLIIDYHIARNVDDLLEIFLKPTFYEDTNILPEDDFIYAFLKLLDIDDSQTVVQQLKTTQKNWLEIFKNHTQAEEITPKMSFVELITEYPYLNYYFRNLMGQQLNDIANVTLVYPSYFKYLLESEWSGQEVEQQLTFLMINFFYYLALDGTTDYAPLACIKDMREKFDLAANYVYYKRVMQKTEKKSYKKALKEMKTKILNTFEQYLQESTLNLSTIEVLDIKNKLYNITFNLGNLPYSKKFEKIENFYQQLPNIDDTNYFKNHLLLLKHRFHNSLNAKTQKDLNIYLAEDMQPLLASSPYYMVEQNMIVLPLASLQYPFFHYTYTYLYQMSLMGFVLSHEVAHAFDSTALITSEFRNCLEKQKPTDDMAERIADLLAERVVYRTYKTCYADAYDNAWQQYFYLNMAQFFCNKGDLEFRNHDADAIRLQQIVGNSPQFAKAFNCSLDSPMNPREKCRLF